MKTILVIEDECFIRESICDVLELEGYHTLSAADGSTGVKLALEYLPDLILCDISMPIMDGYEVLTNLQNHHATNAIPFVFLTARTTKADLRHGMDLGADDYLAKPCTTTELLRAISSRFEKQVVVQTKSEEKLRSLRSNIAQSLPHELYTPLNGIVGFSELLFWEYDTIQRDEVKEIAEAIHTSALRLHHLMQNFLLYTKLELLTYDLEQAQLLQTHKTYSPNTVIQAAAIQVATQAARLPDLQLQLQQTMHPTLAVKITKSYLSKIVRELIDNACKFSEPRTCIKVQTEIEADQFCLTISNQGRGMTAEQIANLGAYMQFDRKHYEQQGSGLGLIITKRIAELYSGDLQIKSSTPETTVQVRLGLAPDLAAS